MSNQIAVITPAIRTIRGQKVILDSDLARIYGVTTKRLNEQVKRNAKRFPSDFLFHLTSGEVESLSPMRSQFATASEPPKTIRSQNATAYLERLAKHSQSSVLLVVVPAAREATVWRELNQRLSDSKVSTSRRDNSVGIFCSVGTNLGPTLALTSWSKLLSAIEAELKDEPQASNRCTKENSYECRLKNGTLP